MYSTSTNQTAAVPFCVIYTPAQQQRIKKQDRKLALKTCQLIHTFTKFPGKWKRHLSFIILTWRYFSAKLQFLICLCISNKHIWIFNALDYVNVHFSLPAIFRSNFEALEICEIVAGVSNNGSRYTWTWLEHDLLLFGIFIISVWKTFWFLGQERLGKEGWSNVEWVHLR